MGDSIHFVDAEPMGGKFCECRLGEMDRDVAIIVAEPGEGSAEEEVDLAHEVNFDVFVKFELE